MNGEVAESKLSVRYQITVPPPVRRFLKVEEGERISWRIDNGKVVVEKKVKE